MPPKPLLYHDHGLRALNGNPTNSVTSNSIPGLRQSMPPAPASYQAPPSFNLQQTSNQLSTSAEMQPHSDLGPSTDKEEGELTEDEGSGHRPTQSFGSATLPHLQAPDSTQVIQPNSPRLQNDQPFAEERWKAKRFIRACHQNGYTMADLIREGLDPEILQGLYRELGINTGATNLASEPSSTNNTAASSVGLAASAQPSESQPAIADDQQTTKPKDQQTGTVTPSKAKSQEETEYRIAEDAHPTVSATSGRKSVTTGLHQPAIAAVKTAQAKPQPPTTEREDYVARLMAAKSQKSITSPIVPSVDGLNMSTLAISPSAQLASSESTSLNQPQSSLPMATQSPSPNVASISEPAVVAHAVDGVDKPALPQKGEADTELARLRLRALLSARTAKGAQNGRAAPSSNNNPTGPLTMTSTNERPDLSDEPQMQPSDLLNASRSEDVLPPEVAIVHQPINIQPHQPEPSALATDNMSPLTTPTVQPRNEQPSAFIHAPAGSANRIPGLFMTLPANNSDVAMTGNEETDRNPFFALLQQSQPLMTAPKRPVAADFDDDLSDSPPKRPFGQPRGFTDDENIIIQVSDDESATGDTDEGGDSADRATRTFAAQQLLNPNFSAHTSSVPSPRAAPSPSAGIRLAAEGQTASSTPISSTKLKSREEQILLMKKKIAELEQKRKAKSQGSGVATPATSLPQHDVKVLAEASVAVEPVALSSTLLKSSEGTEAARDLLLNDNSSESTAAPGVPVTLPPATSGVGVEEGKQASAVRTTLQVDDAGMQLLNWKMKRRLEIEAGIPELDTTLSSSLSKLETLKAEILELETTMREKAEEKARLVEELQALGVDTDGKSVAELQSTREVMLGQSNLNGRMGLENPFTPGSSLPLTPKQDDPEMPKSHSLTSRLLTSTREPEDPGNAPPKAQEDLTAVSSSEEYTRTKISDIESPADNALTANDLPFVISNGIGGNSDQALDKNQDGAELCSSIARPSASQSPNAVVTASDSQAAANATEAAMDEDVNSTSELIGDEVESTGSKSPPLNVLYEHLPSSVEQSEDDDWPPWTARQAANRRLRIADDDISMESESSYEPPDATSSPSRPTSSALPSRPSSSAAAQSPVVDDGPSPANTNASSTSQELVLQSSGTGAGDSSRVDLEKPKAPSVQQSYFTPYESPLATFKAYRFHPDFANNVPSGIRSATFSHSIDMEKPVCVFETAGGVCNDSTCNAQHFRSMIASDDELLRQLGTSIPTNLTPTQRRDYVNGLSQVVSSLRTRNVQDSEKVAEEITGYRRRFLNDPTKVLNY